MPDTCIVCKRTAGEENVALHRFPAKLEKRQQWLTALKLRSEQIHGHHRVCGHHFPNGDKSQIPSLSLGRKFASPKKSQAPRNVRAKARSRKREYFDLASKPPPKRQTMSSSPSTSRAVTPLTSDLTDGESSDILLGSRCTATPGEEYLSDYAVHEIPSEDQDSSMDVSFTGSLPPRALETEVVVNTALIARIEMLEAENQSLQSKLKSKKPVHFRLEHIAHSDSLVNFFTGFRSYELLYTFFEFLGPSVNKLNYWNTKTSASGKRRKMKLDPLNQLFMTLIKLRLNLRERHLAHTFGIAVSVVSKYFITWVCFLYNHLREVDWMPSAEQVRATLPHSFKEKYPKTFIIVDASEVFIETPNDLQLQSSTWSNYKHHNTAKFLVGCTPNGAVSFVSDVYVGSISDVKLTALSGLVDKLNGKSNISVMADRGFTIRDQLQEIGVELNIPPFMEGRGQLPASEVLEGRKIASVRIHVERVIGRIKNFTILKGTLPISLVRIANHIVCVCAWLVNFQPVLIPPKATEDDLEVEEYFKSFYCSDSDYDADTEMSDEELCQVTSVQ